MADLLASTRDKLADKIEPFLDRTALSKAGVDGSDLVQATLAAIVSELSRNFILTPRKPLLALVRERDSSPLDPEALANRVFVLEMALAAARIR